MLAWLNLVRRYPYMVGVNRFPNPTYEFRLPKVKGLEKLIEALASFSAI